VDQDQLDLQQDALMLLSTANKQSHTILWQDAKRAVLAKALKLGTLPQPGDLGELVRLRLLAKEFRGY
jgi:hypothetical protein